MIKYILFCAILLTCFFEPGSCPAQVRGWLARSYQPAAKSGTVKDFLSEMKEKGIPLSYSEAYIQPGRQVTMRGTEQTVQDVLNTLFAGQHLIFIEKDDKILIAPKEQQDAAQPRGHYRTINGFIKEAGSNEVLVSASVYAPGTPYGTVTNSYGYYSLVLPSSIRTLVYSYIGYKADTIDLLTTDRRDVTLNRDDVLDEVLVSADKESSPEHLHMTAADIQARPVVLGENDVMRALQYQAGVQAGIDGSSQVLVRGGDPGQNLNLLDGVPLYYVDHFFGLTSVYNSDAVKSVDFHKGAFPARYGGRLSSIIDVTTRDGSLEKWGGQFSMGLVKSSLNLEGPIIKNKSSIMLSARRTWVDAFWKPFTKDPSFNFYDINGKANYILNENNRLYVSFYKGRDKIKSKVDDGSISTQWGNTIGSVKWNSIVNPKLFVNNIFTYSRFKYQLDDTRQVIQYGTISNSSDYTGTSTINEFTQKIQANWNLNPTHQVELGEKYSYSVFVPVSLESQSLYTQAGLAAPVSTQFATHEVTLFAEDNITINEKWLIRPGIHWATWFNRDFSYSALQPRFYAAFSITPRHILHSSFTQMTQYLHLVNNNSYGLPTDFWIPSTSLIEPEESLMGTLGYKGTPGKNFEYNIDFYYKDITGVTMYNLGKDLFDNTIQWEDKIIQGRGWSYGAEVSSEKKMGSFTAAFAYTLSWTWRKFTQLNGGEAFPYRYDRRHNFKASLVYQRKKFEGAASWTYMSGEAITLPDQVYPDFDRNLMIDPGSSYYSSNYTYNYTGWNNYRLPPIHRLDLGFKFKKQKRRSQREWGIGVFNAYANKNVMLVQLEQDTNTQQFNLQAFSFLQFVPYLTYKLIF